MIRTLILAALGVVLALAVAPGVALYYGAALGAGLLATRNFPCGKAGVMVLSASLLVALLSGFREQTGEAGFYLLFLYGAGALFFTYKKAALDGEAGCAGGACPAPGAE